MAARTPDATWLRSTTFPLQPLYTCLFQHLLGTHKHTHSRIMPVTCPCYHQSANSGHTVSRHEVRERHYLKDVAQLAELESKGADIPPELTTALEENEAITAAKLAGRKRGVQAASSCELQSCACPPTCSDG